jgi:hypothetical protein
MDIFVKILLYHETSGQYDNLDRSVYERYDNSDNQAPAD